jgi:hypothetical protein
MYALDDPDPPSTSPGDSLKVSYYPDIDEMAYAIERNTRRYKLPSIAQYGMFAFLFLNIGGLPLALFTLGFGPLAVAVLIANCIFAIFILPRLLKTDYKRYIRTFYGDIENRLAEIELTQEGLWSRLDGDFTFFRWETVREVEDTETAIHLYLGPVSLSIPSSAFPYREQQTEFARFAYSRSSAAKARQLTQ